MPTLTINGKEVTVEPGATILQACEIAGAEIPRFCYHERLSIAGNCRMCLVEMEKSPKPVASCAMPAGDGMVIHTDTPYVKKAREGVMEFLLINHPLDCPICDQGGECDLQDQAMGYGSGQSRFHENKRAVEEKYMGPLIKTEMTRCIHCTRCIRFATEIAGVSELGAIGRGEHMEITTYLEKTLASEMSGNVIDLCPVGALTSKPYAFTARSWELKKTNSVDVHDAVGSNIRVDGRGNEVMRVLPRLHEDVNEEWISDKTRFAYDGLKKRRLDRPFVKKNKKWVEASWNDAFAAIAKKLKGLDGSKIAAIAGDLQDAESMFALKGLMESIGSANIDCRQDGSAVDPKHRASYLFNTTFAGIDQADACLLVGTDPRKEAAIVNTRLRRGVRENGLKVANVGAVADLTYPVEQLGESADILAQILDDSHEFSKVLGDAKNPMIILGAGALARSDGAAVLKLANEIADKFNMIRDDWNGFNVLQTAASRVGGLDLGFVPGKGGKTTNAILSAAEKGEIEVVFLLGADEIDTSRLKDTFVVYLGTHGDAGVSVANVILPGAAYTEKAGIYVNMEGRVQRGYRAAFPPGDAREDWTIIRALSELTGHVLPYDNIDELRVKMLEAAPHFIGVDTIEPAKWAAFGKAGKLLKAPLSGAVDNFYMTNPITRASLIMAECSGAMTETEGATGTHG